MMTVKQLRTIIKDLPDTAEVWFSPGTQLFAGEVSSGHLYIKDDGKPTIEVEYMMVNDNSGDYKYKNQVRLVTRKDVT